MLRSTIRQHELKETQLKILINQRSCHEKKHDPQRRSCSSFNRNCNRSCYWNSRLYDVQSFKTPQPHRAQSQAKYWKSAENGRRNYGKYVLYDEIGNSIRGTNSSSSYATYKFSSDAFGFFFIHELLLSYHNFCDFKTPAREKSFLWRRFLHRDLISCQQFP